MIADGCCCSSSFSGSFLWFQSPLTVSAIGMGRLVPALGCCTVAEMVTVSTCFGRVCPAANLACGWINASADPHHVTSKPLQKFFSKCFQRCSLSPSLSPLCLSLLCSGSGGACRVHACCATQHIITTSRSTGRLHGFYDRRNAVLSRFCSAANAASGPLKIF